MKPGESAPELRRLKDLAEQSEGDPLDQHLARALDELYPLAPAPPLSEDRWDAMLPRALAISRKRRFVHYLKDWLVNLQWRRGLAIGGLACAVVAGLVAWSLLGAHVERAPRFEAQADDARPGEWTLTSGAALKLRDGAAAVDQTSPEATRIALREGRLTSRVPHLTGGGSYVVSTDDCDVIVHGTRFDVEKRATDTLVEVEQGLVEVRARYGRAAPVFLGVGESLVVSGRDKRLGLLRELVVTAVAKGDCGEPESGLEEYLSLADSGAPEVSGAEYVLALCAAQREERARAIELFESAAMHAGESVRADNALARAAQQWTQVSREEGIQAWRRYLARFPLGLHRPLANEELRRLSRGP